MLDDLRKTIEATIGELTPARAKSLAASLAGPGAAKDQVGKTAADLIEWSQKNRDKIKDFIRREVSSQVGAVGIATQADLDALKKRVRTLERTLDRQGGDPMRTTRKASTAGASRSQAKAATAKTPGKTPAKKNASSKATGASRARS